jgi:glycosyltransferase involved in cell wall biosynthesis
MEAHADFHPDAIIAHSGFGSSLFLRDLFDCPILNYFEYYYRSHDSDMDFRPEFPPVQLDRLRARARNAMILLDLQNCTTGYCPTNWQASLFPDEYKSKISVVFDGIDTEIFCPNADARSKLASLDLPENAKIVTYVSRSFEAMRGFDIFMQVAKRIAEEVPEAIFLVIGGEGDGYGGDTKYTGGKPFKDVTLEQDDYPMERFRFLGHVPTMGLSHLLAASDLHLYFTVPFVMSWSLVNAMACGAPIIASATPPVEEVITHGKEGLLAEFYDIDGHAEHGIDVLRNPDDYRAMRADARSRVMETYSLDVCLPKLSNMYESMAESSATTPVIQC